MNIRVFVVEGVMVSCVASSPMFLAEPPVWADRLVERTWGPFANLPFTTANEAALKTALVLAFAGTEEAAYVDFFASTLETELAP